MTPRADGRARVSLPHGRQLRDLLAAHAIDRPGGQLRILGLCGIPDGSKILRAEVTGPPHDAERLGHRLVDGLLAQGAGSQRLSQ